MNLQRREKYVNRILLNDELYYERFFFTGGGRNVRVPKGSEKDNAEVVVRGGTRTMRKKKFKEPYRSS